MFLSDVSARAAHTIALIGFLCGIGTAQTFTRLIAEDDPISGGIAGGQISFIESVDINNRGGWVCQVRADGGASFSTRYVLVNGVVAFEEDTSTGIPQPAGATATYFRSIEINDNGETLCHLSAQTLGGTNTRLVIRNGVTLYQAGVSTCIAPGSAFGATYSGTIEVWQNNQNQLLLASAISPSNDLVMIRADLDPLTGGILSETLLAREGSVLPGQIRPVESFSPNNRSINGIADNGDAFFFASYEWQGTALNDSHICLNTTPFLSQGDPLLADPSEVFANFEYSQVDFNSRGDFAQCALDGRRNASNSTWLYKSISGAVTVLARNGDPVPSSIGGNWLVSGLGVAHGWTSPISENGDVLWGLKWNNPAFTADTAIMFNDRVVVREGVTAVEDGIVSQAQLFESDLAMSDDGSHAIAVLVFPGGHMTVYKIQGMAGPTGTTFCDPGSANSTGASTTLSGFPLTNAGIGGGMSDLHLECSNGVPSEFGYFLVGSASNDPGTVMSNGRLCLGTAPYFRYSVAGTTSNSIGIFNAAGVLENLPGTSTVGPVGMETGFDVPDAIVGAPQVITAGSTWHFQVWHRDTPAGVGTSNFSNGLSVTF